MRTLFLGLAVAASAIGHAHAHALLHRAVPAVGSVVAVAPTEIRIEFTEAVEPKFSGIAVQSRSGTPVATGAAAVDPSDAKTLVVPLTAPLPPGVYVVRWHVVSVDTHKTQGDFTFTLKP